MALDYSQNLYKDPGTGQYWSLIGGTARPITGDVTSLGINPANIQTQTFGVGSAGYDAQHGGGTTGGGMTVDQYKQNVYGMATPEQRGEVASVVNTPQVNADFRARGINESMSDYLSAKQTAGIGGVQFGTANNQPISAINPSLAKVNNRTLISATPQAGYIKGYDTDQNYKEVYVPKGVYVPGISATPKAGMTPDTMAAASPINVPGATPTGTSGTGADASAFTADYNARMAQEEAMKTSEQKQSEDLTSQITSLIGQEAGKSAYTEEQLKTQVDPLVAQLTGIKNRIEALKVEQDKARLDSEGQPMTLAQLYGENARRNALYNNQIDNLTAQGNALLGNIELAKTQVERAVAVKYGYIEEAISLKQAQLQALQLMLTKQEKVQADVLSKQYEAQKQAISDVKDKEKSIQKLALDYINDMQTAGKTPDKNVIARLQGSTDYNTALGIYASAVPVKVKSGNTNSILDTSAQYWLEQVKNGNIGADLEGIPAAYKNIVSAELGKPKVNLTITLPDGTSWTAPDKATYDKALAEQNTPVAPVSSIPVNTSPAITPPKQTTPVDTTFSNSWNRTPTKGFQPVVNFVKNIFAKNIAWKEEQKAKAKAAGLK